MQLYHPNWVFKRACLCVDMLQALTLFKRLKEIFIGKVIDSVLCISEIKLLKMWMGIP